MLTFNAFIAWLNWWWTWWVWRKLVSARGSYCKEKVDGEARLLLFACFSFCKYISRLASWIASYIFASLIICLIRFSMAGSEFNSKSSDTLLSSSSNDCAGEGGATSFERFRPHPVKALQNGLFAFVSIWLLLNCLYDRGSWMKKVHELTSITEQNV